ncbi:acetoacetate--CoA ligase [Sphingobacterium phlebotomi]|uniref:Acetoacetate--CoA ligase n=1 Tax=Sphingobacterium phlebotomi TaxID=2605433 RepID=A0A5D4H871_9SPHI|nr:acetoacetate--CoA ligase [Sphingobacterium phlebotomi]TYR37301.1 acetoacetate--CoA ligase [Sphingobacterium phlebotomi]
MKKPLWTPSEQYIKSSVLYGFQQFVERHYHRCFLDYAAFYLWSIEQPESFWEAILLYFKIDYTGKYNRVLEWEHTGTDFIGARWFEGISLSYAEHIFRAKKGAYPAIKYTDETGNYRDITWFELREKVSGIQQFLKEKGIQKGDRVVGILNNTMETTAIFLAVNSLGAIWSCCSPDFGDKSITERFIQIAPKILFMELDYQYNGKTFSKRETLTYIQNHIPSIETIIAVYGDDWQAIFTNYPPQELYFLRVPFSHPIWILYSSGTTGKPKAITHSTGGNLLEHYKALAIHQNVQKGENFLWYSTTGWMMWNYALSSLLCDATLCLFNGAIHYNGHRAFWEFVKQANVHHFGGGAAYFSTIHDMKIENYEPKVIGSTGSPLPAATFENLQKKFPDTHIISLSGGTDVCSAFLSGCAYLPVYAGKIQCRTLGSDIVAVNDHGEEVYNEVGELVIKKPMPSMPIYFWEDNDNEKYRESYFAERKGVWSHGDWISIIDHGGIVMYGRSDATLNRGGIRIGTAEIYNVVNEVQGVRDSLVIATDNEKGESNMLLFIQLYEGSVLEAIVPVIKSELRKQYSARHVPDFFYAVDDIPYTLSGKKLEIPIKKIFMGYPLKKAVSKDIMRNPESLDCYVRIWEKVN